MRFPNDLVTDAVFTVAIGAVSVSLLLARFQRPGASRAFWGGFATTSGIGLLLGFAPGFATEVRPRLLSARLLTSLAPHVVDPRLQTRRLDVSGGSTSDTYPSFLALHPRVFQPPRSARSGYFMLPSYARCMPVSLHRPTRPIPSTTSSASVTASSRSFSPSSAAFSVVVSCWHVPLDRVGT